MQRMSLRLCCLRGVNNVFRHGNITAQNEAKVTDSVNKFSVAQVPRLMENGSEKDLLCGRFENQVASLLSSFSFSLLFNNQILISRVHI